MRSKHGRKEKAPHRPALQCDKREKTGSHRHNNTNHSTTIRRSDVRIQQPILSTNPFFWKKIVRKNREFEVAPLLSLRPEKKREEDRFCGQPRYSRSLTASSLGT